jgi:hypothetical protein
MTWALDLIMRSAFGRGALTVLGGLVVLVLALRRRDKARDQRQRQSDDIERLRAAAETRRRMDNADIGTGDPDDDAAWLLERGRAGRREPTLVRRD